MYGSASDAVSVWGRGLGRVERSDPCSRSGGMPPYGVGMGWGNASDNGDAAQGLRAEGSLWYLHMAADSCCKFSKLANK